MIRLRKVYRIYDTFTPTEGHTVVNRLSWFPNNTMKSPIDNSTILLYDVSPYHLKVNGMYNFENLWQSSKLYPKVFEQKQDREKWYHKEELHMDPTTGAVLPAYWEWRKKLTLHTTPVRYPNGYKNTGTCHCCLWSLDSETMSALKYVDSRKMIYIPEYIKAVKETTAYKQLSQIVAANIPLEFMEVDCPLGSTEVTKATYDHFIEDENIKFGHTWALSSSLLGITG